MKRELIFLGPPACGKGTQTNKLSEYLDLPHIDTGSLLRAEITKSTAEGITAKKFIDRGQLVPADLVGEIIEKKLAGEDCKNGYVLDGYPRSLEQANMLEEINSKINKDNDVFFSAIYFDIDPQILLDRIVHRMSCPACGEIYNKKFKPPLNSGKCDKCGIDLQTRADDSEETAKLRFETYFKETAPLIEFYEGKGVLYRLDANGSIAQVWERLLKVISPQTNHTR